MANNEPIARGLWNSLIQKAEKENSNLLLSYQVLISIEYFIFPLCLAVFSRESLLFLNYSEHFSVSIILRFFL